MVFSLYFSSDSEMCVYFMPGNLLMQILEPRRTQNVCINQLEMCKTFESVCLGMIISLVSGV